MTNVIENQDISLTKKFINLLMVAGKKNIAYKIFTLASIKFLCLTRKNKGIQFPNTGKEKKGLALPFHDKNEFPLLLERVIKNVQPSLEGRKCRVAGTTKIVPAIVSNKRGCALAIRWIIESAKKKKKTNGGTFSDSLAQELLEAYQKQGRSRQRRDQYHKTCQGSRGYLRYRWW